MIEFHALYNGGGIFDECFSVFDPPADRTDPNKPATVLVSALRWPTVVYDPAHDVAGHLASSNTKVSSLCVYLLVVLA